MSMVYFQEGAVKLLEVNERFYMEIIQKMNLTPSAIMIYKTTAVNLISTVQCYNQGTIQYAESESEHSIGTAATVTVNSCSNYCLKATTL